MDLHLFNYDVEFLALLLGGSGAGGEEFLDQCYRVISSLLRCRISEKYVISNNFTAEKLILSG